MTHGRHRYGVDVAVDVAVAVGVAVAVAVGVPVGVAVVVPVGVGDGDGVDGLAVAGVVAGCDGDGSALLADVAGTSMGAWAAVVGWLLVGDALAGAAALAVAPAVCAALAVTAPLVTRTASTECGTCGPLSARTVMVPVATTAVATPAAAAIRARTTVRGLGCLIAGGKPSGPNGPARSITSCRYASVGSLLSEHSSSTSSRNEYGSAASGAMASNVAVRTAPRLRLPQISH